MQTATYNGKTYELEATGEPKYPFHLNGPRGAQYTLWQHAIQTDCYIVINSSRMQVLRGYFKMQDGKPVQVR